MGRLGCVQVVDPYGNFHWGFNAQAAVFGLGTPSSNRICAPSHPFHILQVVKFNCNKDNKELGKTLGIKVRAHACDAHLRHTRV
jgi:hypothetical protein